MKTYLYLKITVILLIFTGLISCVSKKTLINQADINFELVVKSMQEIQEADDQKFDEIEAFLATAKTEKIEILEVEKLLESTKKNQLDLKKMTSKQIDIYDEMTKNLLAKLAEIQQLKPENKILKNQFEKIQNIDSQDLTRRIRHDRNLEVWNSFVKKSSKKLRKLKKYKKAQIFPVFTLEN